MTLIETARILWFIGNRDGWAPSDENVAAWHHVGTDTVTYGEAMDRILDHRPAHRISLACVVGNCNPAGPHDITAEEPIDPVRSVREQIAYHAGTFARYGVGRPLTEASYRLMVKAVGPAALEPYLAAMR